MKFQNIDEIYGSNDRARVKFAEVIASLTDDELQTTPDGQRWSPAMIAEHVSIVDESVFKICRKLIVKAQENDIKADRVKVTDAFAAYAESETIKLEAPGRVLPTGEKTVAESREKLAENKAAYDELRHLFEEFDSSQATFPHPHFGSLSALDWLVLSGEHIRRHTFQIQKLTGK